MTYIPEEYEWSQNPEGEALDIIGEQAAFFQEVATLIGSLPGTKQAGSENHTFNFANLPFSTPFELPQALEGKRQAIDDISISVGDAHIPENPKDTTISAYLSIEFDVGNDTYTISSSGESGAQEYTLYKLEAPIRRGEPFEKRLTSAGTVTKAEVNAFLMGIVLPNSAGDYSAYADKDLQSAEAFESLMELLSQKALTQSDAYYFAFDDKETDFHFTKENGQTTSFTLNYFDAKRSLPIAVEYDADLSLRFYSFENNEKHLIIPTGEEINYVRGILKKELAAFEPEQFEQERGVTIEPASQEPNREHLISNELSGLVESGLDQLGLNPPNTSA